jgi:hypothetical protein
LLCDQLVVLAVVGPAVALGVRASFVDARRPVDGLGYRSVAVAVTVWRGAGRWLGDAAGTLVVGRPTTGQGS